MMNTISQIAIAIFGVTAIFLVGSRRLRIRRWAFVLGTLSIPFWYYILITHGLWAIVALNTAYAVMWARGFWTHWIRTEVSSASQ